MRIIGDLLFIPVDRLLFSILLLEQVIAEIIYHEDTEEDFIARYKRNVEKNFFPHNFRQPRESSRISIMAKITIV